jgi:hypothetical protein
VAPKAVSHAKKQRERLFAERAAQHLGAAWILGDDREAPDFVVTEGDMRFGLEITELFMGPQGPDGAAAKIKESLTQQSLNNLRRAYESIADVPLTVKFVGNMEDDNLRTVVPALLARDLVSKPIGYRFVHDTSIAYPLRAPLRVHVTKGLRPDWFSVNDRVGYVQRNPHHIIAVAIESKAKDLARYEVAAGSDVRLLLVADRIRNSGKLVLEGETLFDLHGFRAVYFLSYPEGVIVLRHAGEG